MEFSFIMQLINSSRMEQIYNVVYKNFRIKVFFKVILIIRASTKISFSLR